MRRARRLRPIRLPVLMCVCAWVAVKWALAAASEVQKNSRSSPLRGATEKAPSAVISMKPKRLRASFCGQALSQTRHCPAETGWIVTSSSRTPRVVVECPGVMAGPQLPKYAVTIVFLL